MVPWLRGLLLAALLATAATTWALPASASAWTVGLQAGGGGEAQGPAAPAAPTGAAAACVSSSVQEVTVTWSAVTHASSYTVYDSTTSSGGGYAAIAAGVPGTSWTSGSLAAGHYWFKVAAYVGTNWASAKSGATGESTIATSSPQCTQP